METRITLKNSINSLDTLQDLIKKETSYQCSKEYDIWEMRTNEKGQMERCLIIKKSNMHAVRLFFIDEHSVKLSYTIPNKILNAYFGKSVKARRNVIEIIAGIIKQAILAGPQQKAFTEIEQSIKKIIK